MRCKQILWLGNIRKVAWKGLYNTYRFSNYGICKFILLLRNGVYPYEYINYWKTFNETLLLEKEDFQSHINMKNITDAECTYGKRVYKDLKKIKKKKYLLEYHDLYV